MEALAVVGIVSNILQLTDFCAKITDRTLEFCGRAAELPGSFSDLRVVMSLVGLNLKKLQSRIEATTPDRESLDVLKGAVKLIERDVKIVHHFLEKHLPAPGASWHKVTVKAIISVFSEGKIKRATEGIMQNCELLGQTVTASLPTADEIAKAVSERSTSTIDRRLSVIMNRMQEKAVSKSNVNKTTFNNQQHQHRHSNTGNAINVKGQTQINNTYVTIQMSYDDLGAQLNQGMLTNNASLTVPGTNLPFHPLYKSISNPDLHGSMQPPPPRRTDPPALPASGFVVEDDDEKDTAPTPRATSPRPDVSRRKTTGTPRSRTPQPPSVSFDPASFNNHITPTSPNNRNFPPSTTRPLPTDTQSEIWDSATIAPSYVPSNIGSSLGLHDPLPSQSPSKSPRPSIRPRHSSQNSYSSTHSGSTAHTHRPSISSTTQSPSTNLTSPTWTTHSPHPLSPTPSSLHTSVFELDGGAASAAASLSGLESSSSVRTASDIWSETLVASDAHSTISASSIGSAATLVEDHDAINTVNAFIRAGAGAVTTNPSDAKRAYMSAMNTCKPIVAYTPAFSVRKFRALTLAAVGLSLCTMDRERYMKKARDYNAQAMTAANRTNDGSLVHRVRLDEADLQAKEARMLEKKGAGGDATMRTFTAFGTYQEIAGELEQGGGSAGAVDWNTCALALLGCAKMAAVLGRNPGTFRTSQGGILPSSAYLERALTSCERGRGVMGARQEDLALVRDTEAQVRKAMMSIGR